MKFRLFLICTLLCLTAAEAQISTPIPLPDAIRHGKLDNGMTYFIMHNEEPEDRASFHFAQNVGAILEADDEDGLAHFLEHLAFTGSKNFPDGVDPILEQLGLSLGSYNAYTSHDETVYNIDNVITKDENALNTALKVLSDWSGSILLKDEQIDKERGVIAEEWRSRRDAFVRISDSVNPIKYNGTKYSERDIIGDMGYIRTFPYDAVRNYYKKWYRPDLQAVIVVGDIDVIDMEKKIKKQFGAIPLAKNLPEREFYSIPDFEDTQYVLATDKEMPATRISWSFRGDQELVNDEAVLRTNLLEDLFAAMMMDRLDASVESPDSKAQYFDVYPSSVNRTKKSFDLIVNPKPGKNLEALTEMLTILRNIELHGFLPQEFERQKIKLRSRLKKDIADEKTKDNVIWASELASYFLSGEPLVSAQATLEMTEKFLSNITLEEVNSKVKDYGTISNSLITVIGPKDDAIDYPTKEDILKVYRDLQNRTLEAYAENSTETPIVSAELEPKSIKSTFSVEGIEKAKGYVLENGAKVILYPSDEKEDEIIFQAMSYGGLSKVPTEKLPSSILLTDLVGLSGVGELSATDLRLKLSGKNMALFPTIDEVSEGFRGYSNNENLETLLQLLYARFETPRFDQEILSEQIPSRKEQLIRNKNTARGFFNDKITEVLTNDHPRKKNTTVEMLNEVNYDDIVSIYKDRFSDASDFTFVLAGNLDVEKTLALVQKYIGNLSAVGKNETFVDHGVRPKEGIFQEDYTWPMTTPQSTVLYVVHNEDVPLSYDNRLKIQVLAEILTMRYTDTIRQEEGGSYGVYPSGRMTKYPYVKTVLDIFFDCNPELKDRLLAIVKAEINKIATQGPSEEDLSAVRKSLIKQREEQITEDDYWLSSTLNTVFFDNAYVPFQKHKEYLENMTARDIQKFTENFLKNSRVTSITLNPEESK